MKSRNRTADLLKGVAVMLMVQVHILELFAQQHIFESLTGSILLFLGGPPAAPIFMAVMGYFIAKSNAGPSKSIVRGIKLIGLGLLLNLGLNFHLFVKIFNGSIVANPWPYLFGVDILFLAGLSVVALSAFQKIFKNRPLPYVSIIVFIFLVQLLPYPESPGTASYFSAFFYSGSWWSYFPIVPWLAYPVSGYLFCLVEHNFAVPFNKRTYKMLVIGISGIVLVVIIGYGINVASNLHDYYHHGFLYYLFILDFMVFWSVLFNVIASFSKNIFTNYIEWVGKNVTVFYVMQWLLIGNMATGIYKTQTGMQLILWFAAIVAASSILAFTWNAARKRLKLL